MSSTAERISLDECAREPIHIPGAIQPHGFLMIVDAADGGVLQASVNSEAFLKRPLGEILGRHWDTLVDCEAPSTLPADETRPRHLHGLPLRIRGDDATRYAASWHVHGSRWQLEAEPVTSAEPPDARTIHALIRSIDDDGDVAQASARIARGVQALLGYDRVMVYRFDADWHGEVVAEAVRESLEPYLGLHYPATDIPAQARALYLRNRVRTIGDIRYAPAPLQPVLDPKTGAPADLSDVALRSVSPVHIEYLGNMGVRATLVASIVANEQLWGLIACHHYEPCYPSPDEREAIDVLARALAARVGSLERVRRAAYEMRVQTIREHLISHFSDLPSITAEELRDFSPELVDIVDADGVALVSGDTIHRFGTLPDVDALRKLRARIVETGAEKLTRDVSGVVYTDALAGAFPDLDALSNLAAGVLYVPLEASSRSAILWTRVEQVRTVRWGGNPHLAKLQVIAGARLSPRQSFDAWQEDVRGRSLPWTPLQLEAARSLRVLVEVMDRKHFQSGVGVLHATLDALNQPMIVIAVADGAEPELVHVNQAFVDATGADAIESLSLGWPIRDATTRFLFSGRQAFRLAARDPDNVSLDLQPLGEEGGRRHWLGLLETLPT